MIKQISPAVLEGDQGLRLFKECCRLAGVPPTRRQLRKFEQARGRAYAQRAEASRLLAEGK